MAVRLSPRPLSVAEVYRALDDPRSGGVAVFVGRTRAEGRSPGALRYEADAAMAVRVLDELSAQAIRRFGLRRVEIRHRTGSVEIGAPSVIIGVAAGHRAPAFAGARFLIDGLKTRAPIWKSARARPGRRRPGGRGRRRAR